MSSGKTKKITSFTLTDEQQSLSEDDWLGALPKDRFELMMKRRTEEKGVATFEAYVDENEEINVFPVKIFDTIMCRGRVDEPRETVVTMKTISDYTIEITGRATVEIDLGTELQLEIDVFLARKLPFNNLIILGNDVKKKMQSLLEQKKR